MVRVTKQAWRLAMLGTVFSMGQAQAADTESLGELTVTSTRVEKNLLKVPAAVNVVTQDDIQLGRQQLGLDEGLAKVPGLFMLDRDNFAQDLRISIRGFGARSSFGIRGVRIYTDDLPSTLPDGQGGVDDLDLGSTSRVEVLRGPASSLYGSAAGGVISLFTEDGPATPFIEGRTSYGDNLFEKTQIKAGGQRGRLNYLVNAAHMKQDGYRQHSGVENMNLNSKFRYDFDNHSSLTTIFNSVDSPFADDPGGLTATQVAANRRQAQRFNILHDAGETLTQQKIGFVYKNKFSEKHEIMLRNYYVWKQFKNKLPIPGQGFGGAPNGNTAGGQVHFDRLFFGGGGQYTYTDHFFGHHNRLTIGFDIDSQNDDRRRFFNNFGVIGNLSLKQDETVNSYGVFFQNELALTQALELTVGTRYDRVDYTVDDRFLADGDQSLQKNFEDASPMAGLLWSPSEALNLYTNVSTSFSTPTTTQLANPSGGGGINGSLKATNATQYEVGAKGQVNPMIFYDLSVFHTDVTDELVGFITGGRAFFTNADTNRNGVEAQVVLKPWRGFTTTVSYTYSDFTFSTLRPAAAIKNRICHVGNCDGKRLPGVPEHNFRIEASYFARSGWYVSGDLQAVGNFYADNENETRVEAYQVASLRFGHSGQVGNWTIEPFFGVNNLFGQKYNTNIRINSSDFGGDLSGNFTNNRYFEPAPERNIYLGISARYEFGE